MSTTTGETKVISLYQSQKKIYAKSVVVLMGVLLLAESRLAVGLRLRLRLCL